MAERLIDKHDIGKILLGSSALIIASEALGLGILTALLAAWRAPLCDMLAVQPNCLPSSDRLIGQIAARCTGATAFPVCSNSDAASLRNRFLLHQYMLSSLLPTLMFAVAVPIARYLFHRYQARFAPQLTQTHAWRFGQFAIAALIGSIICSASFIVFSAASQGEAFCSLINPPVNNSTDICQSSFGLQQLCALSEGTPACAVTQENTFSHLFLFATFLPNVINNGLVGMIFAGIIVHYNIKSLPLIIGTLTTPGGSAGIIAIGFGDDHTLTPRNQQNSWLTKLRSGVNEWLYGMTHRQEPAPPALSGRSSVTSRGSIASNIGLSPQAVENPVFRLWPSLAVADNPMRYPVATSLSSSRVSSRFVAPPSPPLHPRGVEGLAGAPPSNAVIVQGFCLPPCTMEFPRTLDPGLASLNGATPGPGGKLRIDAPGTPRSTASSELEMTPPARAARLPLSPSGAQTPPVTFSANIHAPLTPTERSWRSPNAPMRMPRILGLTQSQANVLRVVPHPQAARLPREDSAGTIQDTVPESP